MTMRVLVSVYNVSGYLMACLDELKKEAEIVILQRDCSLTPREGDPARRDYRWLSREAYVDWHEVLDELGAWKPDVFLCCGWSDRLSRGLARYYHGQGVKTVLGCDTPWQGRVKQWLNRIVARMVFVRDFDYAWGAGENQCCYLRKIGFKDTQVHAGYYAADTKKFEALYDPNRTRCSHAFLYIGRYIEVKNMRRMERAFIRALEKVQGCDWTLRCIGDGELWDERTIHPRIEHLGYKSPSEIQNFIHAAGCFVLPSTFEPWGVVVQEAALMGLPMICSAQIHASTAYLEDGRNGYVFNPFDEDDIESAFVKIMTSSDEALSDMGRISHRLGVKYTTRDWTKRILEFAK